MIKRIKTKNFVIILLNVNLIVSFLFSSNVFAQERFLLTNDEIIDGYTIVYELTTSWRINEDMRHVIGIRQKWLPPDSSNSNALSIDYIEFENNAEAQIGTGYHANNHPAFFHWGSFEGFIVADGSWTSGGTALFFVRGNVGIGIHKYGNDKIFVIRSIAEKLVDKINTNLSQNIISDEEDAKEKQIPLSEYQTIVEPVTASAKMTDFTHNNSWDSKWAIDTTKFVTGIRDEWNDESGRVIGLDICKFTSKSDAQKAANVRVAMMLPPPRIAPFPLERTSFYNLDDLDSLKIIMSKFKSDKTRMTSYYMIGIKDNIVLHYYYYDPNNIDWDFFYSIAEDISAQIVNF